MGDNWQQTLARPENSIIDVMRIIEKDAQRVACVVDSDMNLLGLVTDGDIRRALINGIKMEEQVQSIMNAAPKSVGPDYDKVELMEYLTENRLMHMPVVENGKLVDLVTIEDLARKKDYHNPVFLMAGGFGTRLRPLTDNCPKPLLKVGNKPILETILDQFIEAGFSNFFISTHYLPEMIRDYFGDGSDKGVNITYVHEENPLGTGGALGLLPKEQINSPLLMINGDILTNIDFEKLLQYHNDNGVAATMAVREYKIEVPYGVVDIAENNVAKMIEKPSHHFFINAGIYVVSPDIVNGVQPNTKIDMPSLLEQRMSKGDDVGAFPIHEYWLDIGKMKDFEQAQLDVMQGAVKFDAEH